jgi:predicted PurR-regulated permease PerM
VEPPAEPGSRSFFSFGPPGSDRRRVLFFAITAAAVVAIIVVFRAVLAPFALALVLAYVLAPLVSVMTRIKIGRRTVPRWVAVVAIYAVLLGGLSTGIAFGAPRLAAEIQSVVRELPGALHDLEEEWLPLIEDALADAQSIYGTPEDAPPPRIAPLTADQAEPESIRVVPHPEGGYEIHLPENGIQISPRGENEFRITIADAPSSGRGDLTRMVGEALRRAVSDTERYAGTAVRTLQTFVTRIVGGIFSFFITLMLSAYLLITSDRIFSFFRSLYRPERRERFDLLLRRIDKGLAGVVRGQLLIALVNGVLSGVGFWLADLKYWPVLTLIATVLSIIPIFGAIISSIPAVVVGLQEGIGTALFVLAWIIGIHQLEANVLNPKIMGDAAKVHPVLVVFALLAGEHFFGIAGALLAVPVLSITQSLFLHYRDVALGPERESLVPTPAPPGGAGE